MAGVDTIPELLRPMMGKPSVKTDPKRCAVCGRSAGARIEAHHIVRRNAGTAYGPNGRELRKPTIDLCGFGSNLKDADGRCLCHGLAHHQMLHFRWAETSRSSSPYSGWEIIGGHWEYLRTMEPTDYQTALGMKGWRKVR